jgi:hypothetical protein
MNRSLILSIVLLLTTQSLALAGPRERARTMHDRLTGVPATEADLDEMVSRMSDPA